MKISQTSGFIFAAMRASFAISWSRWRVFLVLLPALFLSACCYGPGCMFGPSARDKYKETREPGMYGLSWSQYGDINGEVGHRLYVGGATATCLPSHSWNYSYTRIISGTLPPGLEITKDDTGISGIPTERGNWIVKQKLYNITCGGETYNDIERELLFHITGSGKVVQ